MPVRRLAHSGSCSLGVSWPVGWLCFMGLHLWLTGHTPVWNILGNLPVFLYPVIPLGLLIREMFRRRRSRIGLVSALLGVALGITQADFNWVQLQRKAQCGNHVKEVRLFDWNTSYWDQNKDRRRFFGFLNQQKADILILQEYLHDAKGARETKSRRFFSICPVVQGFPRRYAEVADEARIRATFPEFYYATQRQFVIISRFPILRSHLDPSEQYAYSDLDIYGRTVRIFNVHILLHLEMEQPLHSGYYEALQRRFAGRRLAFRNLIRDLKETKTDYVVAGDFNSTTAMGVMQHLLRETNDAIHYSSGFIPATITFGGLRLWRFDYVLLAKKAQNIHIKSLKILDCARLSDHNPQMVRVNVNLD